MRQPSARTSAAPLEPVASREAVSDVALLARITDGDRSALRSLYVRHFHPLLRFVDRIIRDADSAQEVVNDVMLVVWSNGRSFAGRSTVSTWIFGIAYRKALKWLEASGRRPRHSAGVDFDEWSEHFPDPDELDTRADLSDMLSHGLGRLSPEQRAVVELTYFDGCSYEEIAEITGAPVNTVKTRMFHARAKLRRFLPELGY